MFYNSTNISKMNEINKWFYSLTLNELQEYIVKLESENERLVKELYCSSKMNSVLENIVKSTQNGYSLLRRIEINKNCDCNEHRNTELRKSLNQSISETNLLLNHLHQFLSLKDLDNSDNGSDREEIVDITEESDESLLPISMKHSAVEKELPVPSSSPSSSGYDSIDLNVSTIGAERLTVNRMSDIGFHSEYTPIESQSSVKQLEGMPKNLSKAKSPPFSPLTSPMIIEQTSSNTSTSMTNMTFINSSESLDKNKHLPNKCTQCDLSFNLKPSLEQHLLTHIDKTFTVQRAGRGRPAKNDPRILRVTDSDLNILRMNEALSGLPEGVISLSALEELRRTKFTGFGRYRCPWPDCGYTPHFLRDLRRHMFKHTGDKKYKCNLDGCDFITVWKTSLLQHQRKKHNLSESSNSSITTININNNMVLNANNATNIN